MAIRNYSAGLFIAAFIVCLALYFTKYNDNWVVPAGIVSLILAGFSLNKSKKASEEEPAEGTSQDTPEETSREPEEETSREPQEETSEES